MVNKIYVEFVLLLNMKHLVILIQCISEDIIHLKEIPQERCLNEFRPTPSTSNIEKHYLLYYYICVFCRIKTL